MIWMRIHALHVKNYKSLKDVTLEGLGRLNLLVGKNSSGKSNLLEALEMFFNEFNLFEAGPPAEPVTEISHNIWYDGNIENRIEIAVTLSFDEKECEEIFPKEALEPVKKRCKESYNKLTILRSINDPKTGKRTEYVKWADLFLVRDNKLVSPEEFGKSIAPSEIGEAIPPPTVPESVAVKMLGKIASNLQNKIRGKFLPVKVARDGTERSSKITERASLVDSETLGVLINLGQSRATKDVKKWASVEKTFEDFSSMRLNVRGGEVLAVRGDLYLPISQIGGGDQELLILKRLLMQNECIVGIEEPEMHLHPILAQKVYKIIQKVSVTNQIFVATHSPILLDRSDPADAWLVRLEDKETKITRVEGGNELASILIDLEKKMSDVFFADGILIVESETEKAVLSAWVEKTGFDVDRISIMPARGKTIRTHNIKAWANVAKSVGIPLFLILTRYGREEAITAVQDGTIPSRNVLILSEEIEDYYPIETLVSLLNEKYQIAITSRDIDRKKVRLGEIERILSANRKLHPGWRIALGQELANRMSRHEVPTEFRMFFQFMSNLLVA